MKRISSLALCFILVMAMGLFTACGTTNNSKNPSKGTTSTTSPATTGTTSPSTPGATSGGVIDDLEKGVRDGVDDVRDGVNDVMDGTDSTAPTTR